MSPKLSILAFSYFIFLLHWHFPPLVRGQKWKSTAIVKDINTGGPYIGLITVYPPEEDAFFATGAFQNDTNNPYVDLAGRRFRVGTILGRRVIYVRCGIGLVNGAAATQQMLDNFHIKGLIHFGISGNTNGSMNIGDVTIPNQFASTGLWDWMNPNGTIPSNDVAELEIKDYNQPMGGNNTLGRIGYNTEQFYSVGGDPLNPQRLLWFPVTKKWLHLASTLQGVELQQCVNSSLCLENKPKLVVGLKGATAHIFVDNAAYRDFLFNTFQVSSTDMESTAVVMTSLSNGVPVIVIRGLSDLAGAQEGSNHITIFGSLAASNAANVVIQFIKSLPKRSKVFEVVP